MQEKNKIPNSLMAAIEARKTTEESIKAGMQPSQRIAEVMKQQLNSVEHLKKLTDPTSPIAEMMRQFKQQQQVYADMIRPLKNIAIPDSTSAIKDMLNGLKLSNPISEAMKQCKEVFAAANMFKSIIEEQRNAHRKIVEALKPSFQAQRSLALELSRINSWQDTFRSIADSLKDFRPAVEVLRDALVIEEEKFSQEDINQIAEEYIWDANSNKNIFKQDGKRLSWENIPKPVRWLIAIILGTMFTIYFTAIWKEATKDTILSPKRFGRRLIHFRKQEVRQINKNAQNNTHSPFVNTEYLPVYTSPKKRSRVIAVLSYPTEAKILRLKNKKRWALIEWENEPGEIQQGWSLVRYIYRKNIQKAD